MPRNTDVAPPEWSAPRDGDAPVAAASPDERRRALEREIVGVRDVVAQRDAELAQLRAALLRLEPVDAENHELRHRLEAVQAESRGLRLRLAEGDAATADLHERDAERRAHVSRLEAVVDGMKDSASWRLTAPLRGAKRLGRRRHQPRVQPDEGRPRR